MKKEDSFAETFPDELPLFRSSSVIIELLFLFSSFFSAIPPITSTMTNKAVITAVNTVGPQVSSIAVFIAKHTVNAPPIIADKVSFLVIASIIPPIIRYITNIPIDIPIERKIVTNTLSITYLLVENIILVSNSQSTV
ncbi:MAG: hypothetical protein IJJ57_00815, partial [Ruminococcus sp.]|nr:hypothetical protein [Ruminococcus sp.]